MKEEAVRKLKRIAGILFFAGAFLWWIFNDKAMEKQREAENNVYPDIEDIHHSMGGRISSIKSSSVWNGTSLIMLHNNTAFSISGPTYNRDYKVSSLSFFIKENDSIYKPANTDSIYIYRGDEEYYFVYGKSINKQK